MTYMRSPLDKPRDEEDEQEDNAHSMKIYPYANLITEGKDPVKAGKIAIEVALGCFALAVLLGVAWLLLELIAQTPAVPQ